jgi:hypothetical protein
MREIENSGESKNRKSDETRERESKKEQQQQKLNR